MKKRRPKREREYYRRLTICIIMGILVLSVGLFIENTNFLEPKINELTTSFISFNNKNTTDMLRINNIEKMSDKRGASRWNSHSLTLNISGEKNQNYEIVLYSLTNPIPEADIRYVVKNGKDEIKDNLLNPENTEDGGKILYRGTIENKKTIIRVWVSNDYEGKITPNAFEVKVRPR
jgi:hypothetical protein